MQKDGNITKTPEVYFHLGLPKVASTYFQQVIFPNLNDVTFYPKHKFLRYRELANSDAKGKFLFSCEKDKTLLESVEDITSYFPHAKIILFVRRHDDWILSRYKYRIRKHGSESFSEFFNLDNDNGLWTKDSLFLRDKIEAIEKMCKTPPLIITLDLLVEAPDVFIKAVVEYMDTSLKSTIRKRDRINTAFNDKQLIGLRKWNSYFIYDDTVQKNRFRTLLYRRFNQYLLHLIAFFILLIPGFFVRKKSLLSPEDRHQLTRIMEFYAEDWAFCKAYEKKGICF